MAHWHTDSEERIISTQSEVYSMRDIARLRGYPFGYSEHHRFHFDRRLSWIKAALDRIIQEPVARCDLETTRIEFEEHQHLPQEFEGEGAVRGAKKR